MTVLEASSVEYINPIQPLVVEARTLSEVPEKPWASIVGSFQSDFMGEASEGSAQRRLVAKLSSEYPRTALHVIADFIEYSRMPSPNSSPSYLNMLKKLGLMDSEYESIGPDFSLRRFLHLAATADLKDIKKMKQTLSGEYYLQPLRRREQRLSVFDSQIFAKPGEPFGRRR